jgi:hypothetical protein
LRQSFDAQDKIANNGTVVFKGIEISYEQLVDLYVDVVSKISRAVLVLLARKR